MEKINPFAITPESIRDELAEILDQQSEDEFGWRAGHQQVSEMSDADMLDKFYDIWQERDDLFDAIDRITNEIIRELVDRVGEN